MLVTGGLRSRMIKFNCRFSFHICMRYTRTVSHNFYQRLVHPLRVKTDANIPNVVTVINHRLPRSRQVGLDMKQWHPLLRGVQLSFCVFQISDTLSNTTKLSQLHSLHLLCSAGLVLTLLATTPERFFFPPLLQGLLRIYAPRIHIEIYTNRMHSTEDSTYSPCKGCQGLCSPFKYHLYLHM